MRRPIAAAILATWTLEACASVEHAPPPLGPKDASNVERCRFARSISYGPASADVTLASGGPVTYAYGSPTWYAAPSVTSGSGASASSAGLDFFLGPERLAPRSALETLGDPTLLERYDRDLDRYAAGRHAVWARPLWITLLGGGLGALGGGLVTMATAKKDEATGSTDYGPTLVLLGSSVGLMLLSLPFLGLDLGYQDEAAAWSVRRAIYVPEDQATADLALARVKAHNERVAAGCGAGP